MIIAVVMLLWPHSSAAPADVTHKSQVPNTAHKPAQAPTARPVMQTPKTLRIPALRVEAPIVPVGMTKAGDMGVPADAQTVAWYKLGAIPGVTGNAVLAGHLDVHGAPAVFWNLQKLQKNDKIEVEDIAGQKAMFAVSDMRRFSPQDAPLEQIFGVSNEIHLNLITCAGSWQKNQRDYSHRLVVFATLLK